MTGSTVDWNSFIDWGNLLDEPSSSNPSEYCNSIHSRCSSPKGWRPDALGFLLAQTRELFGRVAHLDPDAFLELKHVLELAKLLANRFPKDGRAQELALVAYNALYQARPVLKDQRRWRELASYEEVPRLKILMGDLTRSVQVLHPRVGKRRRK